MSYNVLIFPCASNVANEIVNSLKNNKHFKCYGGTSVITNNIKKYKDIISLPYISDANFEYELINACKKFKIDLIIPASDGVALELSKIADMIPPKIVGQNNFANEIARDKYKTYQYFKDLLPLAKIYDSNNIEYPIFIKPRVGEGAKNTKIIRTKEEMNLFLNEFDINKFVLMEYLSGEEYTIDCFSHKGKIKFIGPRTREGTISGAALVSNTITDKDMIREFAEYANIISEHLGMDGHWFFQMKKSKSGELKLLEVSTRIAGTSAVNRVLGINFIELSLYNAIGNDID
ncbi:MAG: ATP-grasp domain-containing protein, partial [Peptostreptococcaceae bacterium]